ncbi:MAG: hypothetical protein JSS29_19405 [Proteobacteria bacterium]|nr:hypothetical protein [Pseudomonadota bacterium]
MPGVDGERARPAPQRIIKADRREAGRAAPEGSCVSRKLNGAAIGLRFRGWIRRWVAFSAIAAVLGLAAAPVQAGFFDKKVDPKELVGVHRVAVLAHLGDTFHVFWVGLLVVGNAKSFEVPVPQWGIDPFVIQTVQDDLKAAGQFSAVALEVSGLDLPALYQKKNAIADNKEVMTILLERAKQQGADALLIVELFDWGRTHPFNSPGFGVTSRRYYPQGHPHGCIYTSFMSSLFRVDTGKRLQWIVQPAPCDISSRDQFELRDAWDQYTTEQQEAFERTTKDRIREHLEAQLSDLALIPAPKAP